MEPPLTEQQMLKVVQTTPSVLQKRMADDGNWFIVHVSVGRTTACGVQIETEETGWRAASGYAHVNCTFCRQAVELGISKPQIYREWAAYRLVLEFAPNLLAFYRLWTAADRWPPSDAVVHAEWAGFTACGRVVQIGTDRWQSRATYVSMTCPTCIEVVEGARE